MMVLTLACAIILFTAGALLLPLSAFAQQEETSLDEEEDLAGSVTSDILDDSSGGNDEEDDNNDDEENNGVSAGDDTNTQVAVPITTQNQREANLAAQLGLNVEIVEAEEEELTTTPPPPDDGELPPEETESTVITITGTVENQKIDIDEEAHDAEICSNFPTLEVSGPGVTPLGQTPSCQGDYGWNISPNPDGLDTTYIVEGNSIFDMVEVNDGPESDNDVYSLDANQFAMFDGPGDDTYELVGVLEHPIGESVIYSDSTGNDRMTFSEEE